VAIVDIDENGLKETENLLSGPSRARVLDVADAPAQYDFAKQVANWARTCLTYSPGWPPTHYYDVMRLLQSRLRRRARAAVAASLSD
jgi:hypothetical protein